MRYPNRGSAGAFVAWMLAAAAGPLANADEPRTSADATPTRPLALRDKGIFDDLDARIGHGVARWIDPARTSIVVDKPNRVLTLLFAGHPVKSYPVALGFERKDKRPISQIETVRSLNTRRSSSFDPVNSR